MNFFNRIKEIDALNAYFTNLPNSILFVYGPKSSGKSTLLQEVVNRINTTRYAINFLDLRGVLIYNFESFLDVFFPKNIKENVKDIIEGISLNIGFFALKANEEGLLKKNAFKIMEDKLLSAKKRGIEPIIILDEIQLLQHIYVNQQRHLLDELFNLFVRLTKVTHTAHVVLATSDSYFIEEIYTNAKLQQASKMYLVDHLEQPAVEAWLRTEHFEPDEIRTVWHYLEGSPWEIMEVIMQKQQGKTVEEACQYFIHDKYGKMFDTVLRMTPQQEAVFYAISEKIVNDGYCHTGDMANREIGLDLLKQMVSQDFWFYKVNEQKIVANAKSYAWAFERMLDNQKRGQGMKI